MSADSDSTIPTPPATIGVAAQWACFQRTHAELERRGDAAPDEDWDELFRIEKALLCGPVNGRADAVAKLKAAARSFAIGERHDGADQEAVASVIRWLEALRCRA